MWPGYDLFNAGGVEQTFDWQKSKAIAKLLGTCPSQAASIEEYYALVCPQVRNWYSDASFWSVKPPEQLDSLNS